MDAVCLLLAASTAVMSVSWAVCSLIPVCVCVCVCLNNACYSVLILYDDGRNVRGMKMQEKEVGEDTALDSEGFVTGLHCCLKKSD